MTIVTSAGKHANDRGDREGSTRLERALQGMGQTAELRLTPRGDEPMRRKLLPLILGSALVLAIAPGAMAQNNSRQAGLVNVSTGNVDLLNGVNVAVAANVLVTACDFTVAAAIAAVQGVFDGGPTTCTSATGPITIEQSQPGDGGGTPNVGGNNSRQAGLVNVSLGDVAILNDVNIAAAANVLITACDFTVAAAVLAAQGVADGGQTTCESEAGEILIDQTQ